MHLDARGCGLEPCASRFIHHGEGDLKLARVLKHPGKGPGTHFGPTERNAHLRIQEAQGVDLDEADGGL